MGFAARLFLLWAAFLALPAVAAGEAISVSPPEGPVGQSVTVTGSGWITAAGEGVFIFISGIEVATAYPDANGAFSVRFVVPNDTPEGIQTISGHRGFSSLPNASTSFTVTAAPNPQPGPVSLIVENAYVYSRSPNRGSGQQNYYRPGKDISFSIDLHNPTRHPVGPLSANVVVRGPITDCCDPPITYNDTHYRDPLGPGYYTSLSFQDLFGSTRAAEGAYELSWRLNAGSSLSLSGTYRFAVLKKPGGTASCDQMGSSYYCTILSTAGWQKTPVRLAKGSTFKIAYVHGSWTADGEFLEYVSPAGYRSALEQDIDPGCELVNPDNTYPYGALLGKIGYSGIFFAGERGTDAVWLKAHAAGPLYMRINESEACQFDNDGQIRVAITSEQVDLTDNIKPGGTWVEPTNHFSTSAKRLTLSARVSDNPGGSGIAKVNFTAWWPGLDDKIWYVICADNAPKHGTTDIYECEWDLRLVPPGRVRVSFDVYDKAGNSKLAPNGVHKGTILTTTPTVATEIWECKRFVGCVFRIDHERTQALIRALDRISAPGVDDQLVYACGSILLATGGTPPGWGCLLLAATLKVGLPLTQILLTNFDTGEGVVIYTFYGAHSVILPPKLSPIR